MSMEIATVLFTYNRPEHTEKVLKALSKNEILPSKLIIFQDGMKESTNVYDWEKVGQIINNVKWCDTEVYIAPTNKGLAESIVYGVTYALKRFTAVIVLEDDCVPHPKFMTYMISALNKYFDKKQVYSIGGCAWPVDLQSEGVDAYFCGRISSWGWGTWQDRWIHFERDYTILKKIRSDIAAKERLDVWGNDLEGHLLGNITGKCDSWAVFWALKVIEKGGYCLSPHESLITNIGCDGTGRHCGKEEIDRKYRAIDNMGDYVLPDSIKASEECENAFKELLSPTPVNEKLRCYQNIMCMWIEMKQKGRTFASICKGTKKPIAVWGKGRICDLLLQEWGGKENVKYIIESRPKTRLYHNIPVVSIEELPLEIKTIVVIPIYDMALIKHKINRDDVYVVGIDELINNIENPNDTL